MFVCLLVCLSVGLSVCLLAGLFVACLFVGMLVAKKLKSAEASAN
jgi:hypothetical protein